MRPDDREKRWQAIKRFEKQDMVCCKQTLAKRYDLSTNVAEV